MSTVFSATIFSYYLLEYCVKYLPGSVFVNKGLFGAMDILAFFYIQMLQRVLQRVPSVMRVCTGSVIVLSGAWLALNAYGVYPGILPVVLGLLRMAVTSLQSYCYHANSLLFPVLLQGTAFSSIFAVSRLTAGASPMVVEYMPDPILLVLAAALLSICSTFLIREPSSESQDFSDHYVPLRGNEPQAARVVQSLEDSLEQFSNPAPPRLGRDHQTTIWERGRQGFRALLGADAVNTPK